MKYVRTKDEVLSCSRNNEDFEAILTDQKGWVKKENVLKQSDTIEELCDGFWWEDSFYDKPVFIPNYLVALDKIKDWKESDRILDMDTLDRITIYGSTYVKGQGWIHVAKMNEKGQLELL